MASLSKINYRKDCYFYHESQDMHAYVPNCCFDKNYAYGFCPCSENCENYISKSEVSKLVRDAVHRKKEDKNAISDSKSN